MGTAIIINDADYSKKNLGSVTQYNKQYYINLSSSHVSLSFDYPSEIIRPEYNISPDIGVLKTDLVNNEYVSSVFDNLGNVVV